MSRSGDSFAETGVSLFDWTFEDHKAFEHALARNLDKADRWERIASSLNNKSPQDVHNYFLMLEDDVRRIELGQVPVPAYEQLQQQHLLAPASLLGPLGALGTSAHNQCTAPSMLIDMPAAMQQPPATPTTSKPHKLPATPGSAKNNKSKSPGTQHGGVHKPKAGGSVALVPPPPGTACPSPAGNDKRKGVPWTEEEHRLFLLGLTKFGKGDWRSIARNFVTTRTPTQVASHAQKYFIRLNSANKKDKRRASIHDITSASLTPLDIQRGHSGSLDQQTRTSKASKTTTRPSKASMPQPPLPPPPPSYMDDDDEDDEEEADVDDDVNFEHHQLPPHHQQPYEQHYGEGDDSSEQQFDDSSHEGMGFAGEHDDVAAATLVVGGMEDEDEPAMHHHHYPLHHHFESMIMPDLVMLEQDAY